MMQRRQFVAAGACFAGLCSLPQFGFADSFKPISKTTTEHSDLSRLSSAELASIGLESRATSVPLPSGELIQVEMKARIARRYDSQFYIWYETDEFVRIFDTTGVEIGQIVLDKDSVQLNDFALDDAGNIYLIYQGSHQIVSVDHSGRTLFTTGRFGIDNEALLNGPTSLTFDAADRLHVLNSGTNTVKVYNTSGAFLFEYGQSRLLRKRKFYQIDGRNVIAVSGGMQRNQHWRFSIDGEYLTSTTKN